MTSRDERNFRVDINGLRAFAVLSVVFYHFGIPGFDGGFMGVDVFFTISGYLMTQIILGGLESGKFSLSAFYLARARRILPALLFMAAIVLIVAWFLPLAAHEYRLLAKHVRDSTLFISNITYARESGYFDTSAHEKWLLHTWSLSVEWQFYLLLPLILLGAKRLGSFAFPRRTIAAIAGASLLWSLYLTATHPSNAFFGLPSRAWELLAGGLVYILAEGRSLSRNSSKALSSVGIGTLTASCFFLSPAISWPGWMALFPVIAGCLVIAAQDESNRVLSNPFSQWLGLRSYSIYLWHWPFVVLLGIYGWKDSPVGILLALLASMALGAISFRYVESVCRKRLTIMGSRRAYLVLGAMVALVAVPAALLQAPTSLPARSLANAAAMQLKDEPAFGNPINPGCFDGLYKDGCIVGADSIGVLMVGDSHAGVTVTSSLRSLSEAGTGIRFWGKGGCMTVLDVEAGKGDEGQKCIEFNNTVLNAIRQMPADIPLVVVNRWAVYTSGVLKPESHITGRPQATIPDLASNNTKDFLAEFRKRFLTTACNYAQTGRPVYYVLPIPDFSVNVPNELARRVLRYPHPIDDIVISMDEYQKRNAFAIESLKLAQERCGIRLLDPLPYLCRDGKCFGSQDGLPLFTDNNHLNERGRRMLAPMFAPVVRKAP